MQTQITQFKVTSQEYFLASGSTIPTTVLVLTPNDGWEIDALDFSATVVSPVSDINFTQDGANVLMIIDFEPGFTVTSTLDIPITMQGTVSEDLIELDFDYTSSLFNATSSGDENGSVNANGEEGEVLNVFSRTITADSGYFFKPEPTCIIISDDYENYNTVITDGRDSNNRLVSRTFDVSYTFPNRDVAGDRFMLSAYTEAIPLPPAIEIVDYQFDDSDIFEGAVAKNLTVIGTPGAALTITTDIPGQVDDFNGTLTSSPQVFLIGFPTDTAPKTYTITIGGDLASPFPKPTTITVDRIAGSTPEPGVPITINVVSGSYVSGPTPSTLTKSPQPISGVIQVPKNTGGAGGGNVTSDYAITSTITASANEINIPTTSNEPTGITDNGDGTVDLNYRFTLEQTGTTNTIADIDISYIFLTA